MSQRFTTNYSIKKMKSSLKFFLLIFITFVTLNSLAQTNLNSRGALYLQLGASGGFSSNLKKPVFVPLIGFDAPFGIIGFRTGFQFFNSDPQFDFDNYLSPIKSVVNLSEVKECNANFLLGFSPYLSFGKGALRLEPGLSFKYLMQRGGTATAVYHQSPYTSILSYPAADAKRNLFLLEPNFRLTLGRSGQIVRFFAEAGYSFPLGENSYEYSYRNLNGVADQAGNIDETALMNAPLEVATERIMPGFFSFGAGIELRLFSGRVYHKSPDLVEDNTVITDYHPDEKIDCDCSRLTESTVSYTGAGQKGYQTIPIGHTMPPAELKICAGTSITFRIKYSCSQSTNSCVPKYSWNAKGDLYNSYGETETSDELIISFVPKNTGLQKISVGVQCGTNNCQFTRYNEAQFEINVVEIDPCLTCNCGNWNSMTGTFTFSEGQGNFSVRGTNNTPVSINQICAGTAINLPLNFGCSGDGCNLEMSWSVLGPVKIPSRSGSVVNFTPTVAGLYTIVAKAKCGETVCQELRIPLTIKEIDPCLTCNCVNWNSMTGTFTFSEGQGNFSVQGTNNTPVSINQICAGTAINLPLNFGCSGDGCNLEMSWSVLGPVKIPSRSGSVVNFTPTVAGLYTIVAKAKCGETVCQELRIPLTIKEIDPCLTCNCGNWNSMTGTFTFSEGQGNFSVQGTNNTPVSINQICAGTAINLPLNFGCSGDGCNLEMSWSVLGPVKIPSRSGSVVNFTPTVAGLYTIVAKAKCGETVCQELQIPLTIKEIDPCMTCNCGNWNSMTGTFTFSEGQGNFSVQGTNNSPVSINQICAGTTINLPLNFGCSGDGCNLEMSWSVLGPVKIPSRSGSVVNFTPTVAGLYTIVAKAKCGETVCQELQIPLTIKEIDPCLTCNCGNWNSMTGTFTFSEGQGNFNVQGTNNTPVSINQICAGTAINLPLNFGCSGDGCNLEMSWSVLGPVKIPSRSGSVVNFTPTVAGLYTIVAKAKCGETVCQELQIPLTIKEIDPCLTCNCGNWNSMTGTFTFSEGQGNFNVQGTNNTPVSINQICAGTAINLPLNFGCLGDGCNLEMSWSVLGPVKIPSQSGSVVNFTPTIAGLYTIVAKAKCGETVCQELRIPLTIKEIDPCLSCNCGNWNSMTGTFTFSEGQGNFNVQGTNNTPVSINQICAGTAINLPLNFGCSGDGCNLEMSWSVLGPVKIPSRSGSVVNFTPTIAGLYTIVAKAKCGETVCQELRIPLTIKEIDPCLTCNCGNWNSMTGTFTFSEGQGNFNVQGTNNTPVSINQICAGTAINLPLNFGCSGDGCNLEMSWSVLGPVKIPSRSSSVVNFTPTVAGLYTIVAKAKCGETVCQELRIPLTIKEIDPCLSCNCGNWNSMTGTFTFSEGQGNFNVQGTNNSPVSINQICAGTAINLPLNFGCSGDGCNLEMSWSVLGPVKIPSQSGSVVNFTPTVAGLYTIVAKAKCGETVCQELQIPLTIKEIDPCLSCNCGNWNSMTGTFTFSEGQGNFSVQGTNNSPVSINQICAGTAINLPLNFGCSGDGCNLEMSWSVLGPVKIPSRSGSVVNFTPTIAGLYTIVAKAKCGETVCQELRIPLTIKEIDPCLTCNCGNWNSMTGTFTFSEGQGNFNVQGTNNTPVSINQICAGTAINLPLNFGCSGDGCNLEMSWSVLGPVKIPSRSGSVVSFTPTVAGLYTIVAKAKCGETVCQELRIPLTIKEIDPCLTCNCGNWNSMTGTFTFSEGQGNFSVQGTNNTPVSINQICTGTAINLPLNFGCSGDGCNLEMSWSILGPVKIPSRSGSVVSFTPTVAGLYTIVAKAKCGETVCQELRIPLTIKEIDPCLTCNCGNWENGIIKWQKPDGSQGEITLKDYKGEIIELSPFARGSVSITAKYNCSQSYEDCQPIYELTIKQGDGTILSKKSPVQMLTAYTENLTAIPGVEYIFEFSVSCNNKDCSKYILKFRGN